MKSQYKENISVKRTGFFSSISLAVITLITFAIAMTAVPKSGPFCTVNCIEYPYLDSLTFYPGDYYWMYLAILQLVIWLIFMISLHFISLTEKKIFSFISISFALISSIVLFADYFIQFSVVPVSLMKGETDGIALITQYNDHGIFIALEELGYIMMSISFLFMAFVFSKDSLLERSLRWIFIAPFILSIISLIYFSIKFGVDRSYRFEITIISINWLAMVAVSILAGVFFKSQLKKSIA
ncbi:MAG: hypothetical protein NTY95_15450 [Bacteroidia bacterium]|nr:hypothetical protein [Bacteroidia bacterium]